MQQLGACLGRGRASWVLACLALFGQVLPWLADGDWEGALSIPQPDLCPGIAASWHLSPCMAAMPWPSTFQISQHAVCLVVQQLVRANARVMEAERR